MWASAKMDVETCCRGMTSGDIVVPGSIHGSSSSVSPVSMSLDAAAAASSIFAAKMEEHHDRRLASQTKKVLLP